MGIGREVADAYIEVHGDLSPFRKKLSEATKDLQNAAIENSDSFAEAWDKNLAKRITSSWDKVVDGLASGRQVDLNEMIKSFDSTDLDNASAKIHDLLNTMREAGKLTGAQYDDTIKKIDDSTKAMQRQGFVEADLAQNREQWNKAHLIMMANLADAREKAAKQEASIWDEAMAANKAYDARRRKTMEDAIAENERWGRSFAGITKNANLAQLEKDFRSVTEAIRSADFSSFNKGFDSFTDLRRRVNEVTAAMYEQKRVTREQAFEMAAATNEFIDGEERKLKATQDALDAAKEARLEQERFKASFEGMVKAAKEMDLEQRFRGVSAAMSTMDFSGLARGARDMDDLRAKTLATATEMRNLGRMTQDEFDRVSTTITAVSADMDSYNVRFREANDSSTKHKRDWTVIHNMIANAGKKFAGFSGLNVLTDMFREGADFFQNIDRNAVKIGKMTLLIGSAASTIITAVGGLAVMGQDLAAIGNIGILAPGFLTAIGIGVGVAVAAFKDMGTVLEDLGPKFGALQDVISEKFWAQAEAPIRNLVDGLLPTLNTQLGNTATQMGGLVGAFATAFAGAATPERVTVMFERMNSAIDIAKGAMEPLVQAFVTLGEVGSQYFERFATWIVDISTRFNNFIQAAAADGRLNAWIETAITNLQAVGSIIGSVVEIFNAIGDAAERAGIGGLTAFAGALERAADVMQTSGFQDTLTMLFSGAEQAAGAVATALFNLGPAIQSIMPTINLALVSIGDTMATVIGYIGQIMQDPAVQQGITDFIGGISTGVAALAPAIGPMAASLGQIGSILGQVAAQLGPLVAAFITGLAPVLDQVTAAFSRITFAAGPVILDLINQIVPVFQNLMDTILPPLENLIMTLLPLLGPAFAAITPIIDALMPIFGSIVSAIGQLVAMIAPYLVPALQQISAAVTPVIEVLGQVVSFILSVLVPILGFLLIGIINNVVGVFQGLSNFIMGFVQIVTAIFTGFGTFFTKLFSGDIGGALTALGDMFKGIWDGIVKMLQGALEFLWNAVQLLFIGKLIGGIKTGLTSIGAFFKSAWDDIVNGVKNAFTSMQNGVSNGLNAIGNFFRSGWNNMVTTLQNAWNTMVSAVSTGVGNVMTWVQGIPGKIGSALSGLGNLLVNAGKAIIDGLLQGLKNAWGAVTSFVGGIADWIANNKGPLPYDRQLLVPAGKAIMDGLGNGLTSKLAMLKGVLDTVTSTMEDSITDAFAKSRMYVAGADAALGLADGLKSRKSDVANALNAVMPSGPTASGSVNLTANGSGNQGAGTSAPAGNTIIVEAGAIPITTPTKDPELVASKVIDGFAGFSNF